MKIILKEVMIAFYKASYVVDGMNEFVGCLNTAHLFLYILINERVNFRN